MDGALFIVRTIFVITAASLSYQLSILLLNKPPFDIVNMLAIIVGAVLAILFIWVEIKYSNRFVIAAFSVILGLLIGFIGSYLFVQAIFLIPHIRIVKEHLTYNQFLELHEIIKIAITFLFCYLSIAIVYKTRDRFKLLIPFVDFTKEGSERFYILDSSVIIDGRIEEIYNTNILKGTLVIPQFIIQELQSLADSNDKKKRLRGRRGLDIITEIQQKQNIKMMVENDLFQKIKDNDHKLLALAKKIEGVIITNDYNLKKIASIHEIEVINLNSLANALRPTVFPGEILELKIIRQGEEEQQGIAYLEDGTVVVIDNGRKFINKNIAVEVTNVLQNNIGRMVFAKVCES